MSRKGEIRWRTIGSGGELDREWVACQLTCTRFGTRTCVLSNQKNKFTQEEKTHKTTRQSHNKLLQKENLSLNLRKQNSYRIMWGVAERQSLKQNPNCIKHELVQQLNRILFFSFFPLPAHGTAFLQLDLPFLKALLNLFSTSVNADSASSLNASTFRRELLFSFPFLKFFFFVAHQLLRIEEHKLISWFLETLKNSCDQWQCLIQSFWMDNCCLLSSDVSAFINVNNLWMVCNNLSFKWHKSNFLPCWFNFVFARHR